MPADLPPPGYQPAWRFDLRRDRRLLIRLQLAALAGLGIVATVGWWLFGQVRPEAWPWRLPGSIDLMQAGLLLLAAVLAILLHELVHALFFWLFSRDRPTFGMGPGYFFAACPGHFFPPRQYLVVGLAPFAGLTAAGLALLPLVPGGWLPALFCFLVTNAAGAAGDLMICWRIASEQGDALVQDLGDDIEVYRPQR